MALNKLATRAFAAAALAGASVLALPTGPAQAQSGFTFQGLPMGQVTPAQQATTKHAAAFLDRHFDTKTGRDTATVQAIVRAGSQLGYAPQALGLRVKAAQLAHQFKSHLSDLPVPQQVQAVRKLLAIASNEPYEIRTDARLSDPALKDFFVRLANEQKAMDAAFDPRAPKIQPSVTPPAQPQPKRTFNSGLEAMAQAPAALPPVHRYVGQFPGVFDNNAQSTFKLMGETLAQMNGGRNGAELASLTHSSLFITYCAARKYDGRVPSDLRDPDIRTVIYTAGLVAKEMMRDPYYSQAAQSVSHARGGVDVTAQLRSIIDAGERAGAPGVAYPTSNLDCRM
jgi:hypothetical protein